MKKLFLLVAVAFVMMSSTPKGYGDYVLVTNESYNAVLVEIYYDYRDDTGYTYIGSLHIPGHYTKSFPIKRGGLFRYAYSTNKDERLFRVSSNHIRIY